jgi:hypothetical protein
MFVNQEHLGGVKVQDDDVLCADLNFIFKPLFVFD